MSRTYRRTHIKISVKKDICHWSGEIEFSLTSNTRWDQENHFWRWVSQEELESKEFEADVAKYYRDAGTRKNFRCLKRILNNRYRELNRKQLRNHLRQEDGELQTYDFRKFDFGYWWD